MGCADPRRRGFGSTTVSAPLGSVASHLIYADVRLHVPTTHRVPLRYVGEVTVEDVPPSPMAAQPVVAEVAAAAAEVAAVAAE